MSDRTELDDETDASSDNHSTSTGHSSTGTERSSPPPVETGLTGTDLIRKLQWGGLILLVGAAVVATIQLYTSSTRAIRVWVGPGYQPLFMAAFNLAVLLFAVAGISVLARRLEASTA